MLTKYKNLIIAVAVIVLLFVGYSMYFKDDGENGFLTSTNQSTTDSANALGADIIRAINQIDSLDLDASVLSHSVLVRLVDKTQVIDPQDKERENPFAPLDQNQNNSEDSDEGNQ